MRWRFTARTTTTRRRRCSKRWAVRSMQRRWSIRGGKACRARRGKKKDRLCMTDDGRRTTIVPEAERSGMDERGPTVTRHSSLVIVDYGVGNLRSVHKAVEAAGATAEVITSPDGLAGAAGIVLPGVGAFGDAAANLRAAGFEVLLRQAVVSGTPLLGICVGMQMLFDESEEMGRHAGPGIIPGSVVRFAGDLHGPDGRLLKVPADWLESALPCPDRPAASWRAGWRLRVLRAFLLLRSGPIPLTRWQRPTSAARMRRSSGEATSGASSAIRRKARRWDCGYCGISWRSWNGERETRRTGETLSPILPLPHSHSLENEVDHDLRNHLPCHRPAPWAGGAPAPGRSVRGQTTFVDDPAAVARRGAEQGAEWLHVVNLDGALTLSGQGQGLGQDQEQRLNPSLGLNLDLSLNLKRLARAT